MLSTDISNFMDVEHHCMV